MAKNANLFKNIARGNDENMGIIAPIAKRRRLDHVPPSRQEAGENAHYLSTQPISSTSLEQRKPNESSSRARELHSTELYAGGMYKSNLFKLQVDEMLRAVQPNYAKMMEPVDKALRRLKTLIGSIENREPLTVVEAVKFMHKSHKITIPFPEVTPNKDGLFKLAYSPPSEFNVVGSYALKTMVKGDHTLAVDMVVTLPPSILQDKDYLNYRYFYKRAYYLACLAAGLRNGIGEDFDICFDYLGGNDLQPILVVKPVGDNGFSSCRYLVHIIPAAPQDFFVETKLRPSKNALRPKVRSTDGNQQLAPTPFYNATMRADSNVKNYLNLLHQTSKHSEGFREACILGRIWLRQRGFGGSISAGGFGHFEWATLTALLLQGGGLKGQSILSPSYSSYQLFKAVIQYLSSTDLIASPVLFKAPDGLVCNSNSPVFYDGPRGLNILFKMTPWSYATLLEEAKISVEMLNDSTFDQFESSFILRKDNPLQQFDMAFRFPYSINLGESSSLDHASHAFIVPSKVYAILKEGLTDRVKIIQLKVSEYTPWPLNGTPFLASGEMLIGVVFDPVNVDRSVDHGPPSEDKSATRFRKFWGEKAELRRFRDGRILESLVWSNAPGRSIFKEIVIYLLSRHLGAKAGENVTFLSHNFSQLLLGSESCTRTFVNLKTAFNMLEQDIRSMGNLPLQPKLVSSIDGRLYHSAVVPPDFSPHHRLQEPVEVLVQFEGSGRWPDDIIAIQRTKVAFLLKIGDLLASSIDGLTTRLCLENSGRPFLNCGVLDVLYPSGATFRLRIYVDREQTLLERLIKEKALDIYAREEAMLAKSTITHMCVQLPLHSQSVATHCTRYPALSLTIRLVKKWFNSHMLFGHFKEELIELIVLRTFLQPYPWRAPSSASTGLLRTLQFLSRWDWRVTPLIVDFSGTMTSEDIAAINTRLMAWRKIDAGMKRIVLFAATDHDVTGTAFTDRGPSKVAAARMTALARSACLMVKEGAIDLDIETLFRSSTDDYDFLIHISPNFTASRRGKNDRDGMKYKNLEVQAEENLSLVGYEPVLLLLEELQRLFTTSIMFFYDPLSKSAIGGLWNPDTKCRPLKINLPYSTSPLPNDLGENHGSEVEINKLAVLSDIARLGGDMVARIELHRL